MAIQIKLPQGTLNVPDDFHSWPKDRQKALIDKALANPPDQQQQPEQDLEGQVKEVIKEVQDKDYEEILNEFFDFVFSGGIGGYGGAGAEHAPASKGVVDLPELSLPDKVWSRIAATAKGAASVITKVPGVLVRAGDAILQPFTKGVAGLFGYKNVGESAGVETGELIPDQEKAGKFSKAGGKRLLRAHNLIEVDGKFYYDEDNKLENALEIFGTIFTIILGGEVAGAGASAVISRVSILALVRQLGWKNIVKLFTYLKNPKKAKQAFDKWKASRGVKGAGKIGTVNAAKFFSKAEIAAAQHAMKNAKLPSPPGHIKKLAQRLGVDFEKGLANTIESAIKVPLRMGASLTAEYQANKALVKRAMDQFSPGKIGELSEEDKEELARWYSVSLIFSRIGAVWTSKTFGTGPIKSITISEAAQYILFILGGGGGDTALANVIRELSGGNVEEPQKLAQGGYVRSNLILNRGMQYPNNVILNRSMR